MTGLAKGSASISMHATQSGSDPRGRSAVRSKAAAVILAVASSLVGCSSGSGVKSFTDHEAERVSARRSAALPGLSAESQQTLRLLALDEAWLSVPVGVLRSVALQHRNSRRPELLALLAELSLVYANAAPGDTLDIAAWRLFAAHNAYRYLFYQGHEARMSAFDPRFDRMVEVYNLAASELGRQFSGEASALVGSARLECALATFDVALNTEGNAVDISVYDRVIGTDGLVFAGLRNRHRRFGMGATLVFSRDLREGAEKDRYHPPEGVFDPLTAMLDFEAAGDGPVRVRMSFYDPRRHEEVLSGGRVVPLAGDFTAPYALLADRAKLPSGLFDPDSVEEAQGLYLLQSYDPSLTPLVMVHGLRSTPYAWVELTNDLMGDEEIRSGYQVWHYMYPTALPYLYAGMLMREEIAQVRELFDPEGDDRASKSMVFLAHSMGGLLAKTMAIDSGEALWNAVFQVPPDQLVGDPEQIDQLRQMLVFEPRPYVDRIVFMATPHRGAPMANSFAGRIGRVLSGRAQGQLELIGGVAQANPNALAPEWRNVLMRGGPTSIRALAPNSPIMGAYSRLEIDSGVRVHSIIGDRGKPYATPRTDGVVPYWSAHLDQAASEVVVPSRHDVYEHPLAILEVKRLLELHLLEMDLAQEFR